MPIVDEFYVVLMQYWRFKGQVAMDPAEPAESPDDVIEIPSDVEEDLSEVWEVIKHEPMELEENKEGVKPVELEKNPAGEEKDKKVKPVDLEENAKVSKTEPEETPEQAVLSDPYFCGEVAGAALGETHVEREVVSSPTSKDTSLSDDELNMRIATLKFLCLHSIYLLVFFCP